MYAMSGTKDQKNFEKLFTNLFLDDWKEFKKEVRQNFTSINAKMVENTAISEATRIQAEKTNGKVLRLEDEVKLIKAKHTKKVQSGDKWYTDTKLIYIAAASILIFLLILAAILGVKVPKI